MSIGPDRLLPADSFTTTSPDGAVKLRIGDSAPDDYEAISVPTLVKRVTAAGGDHAALAVKRDGKLLKWSYKEYLQVGIIFCHNLLIHAAPVVITIFTHVVRTSVRLHFSKSHNTKQFSN